MTPGERAEALCKKLPAESDNWRTVQSMIELAIEAAILEEREACAKIADDVAEVVPAEDVYREDYRFAAEVVGRNIRARSNTHSRR